MQRNIYNFRHIGRKMPSIINRHCSTMAILPRLPVPALDITLKKYVRTVKPFLNENEFNNTLKLVKQFEQGIGKQLQSLLMKKAENTENWLADWWLTTAYLAYRNPVVVYSSPGQVFQAQDFQNDHDTLKYAAKIITAAIDFKRLIDEYKLPMEKMGKDPLDMSQYNKVYGTCRIPGEKCDSLRFNPYSQYIVIASNNKFFKLPVYGLNGPLNEEQIFNHLMVIKSNSVAQGIPIGVLTSEHRDTWGQVYKELASLGKNKDSLEVIQNSLFLVCLDTPLKNPNNLHRNTISGLQLIHAGGSQGNAGNRWYDKTMQFVVSRDGVVGMTYEHSPSEGQPIAVLTDYIHDYIAKGKGKDQPAANSDVTIEQIDFEINEKITRYIRNAYINIDKLVNNLDLYFLNFTSFGKDFIKSQKMSPDSFIQMAIQYAFYRIHKTPGSHYESASTRKYIHGRTETIRSCSIESVEFSKKMLDSAVPDNAKADALRLAVQKHKQYTVEALNGYGVDRHLLGLKLIAAENGIELPDLYQDIGYNLSSPTLISTSQVASRCDGFMCYGPLRPDGYGCCYNPREKNINFGVSAFNEDPKTDAMNFCKALEQSLSDMHNVLIKTLKAKL